MWLLILTAVMGLGFSGFLPRDISTLLKLFISLVIGIIVFTQLLLLLSFLFGVTQVSITVSLVGTALLSLFCFFKFKPEFKIGYIPIIFSVVSLLLLILTTFIWRTQTLALTDDGYTTGGGGMYGDTALHAAYVSRFETGEFPIQNPLFAGKTLVYPFANDLLSAALRLNGASFNLAFLSGQVLFMLGFLSLFYVVSRKITSPGGFAIGSFILFFGWGIGALFFAREWDAAGGKLIEFLTNDYTNNELYNLHFHNILTGLILPERSFLPGLFLGLLMFVNFSAYFKERKLFWLILNGIILGILPLWHSHTFIFFSISTLIFCLWDLAKQKFSKQIFLHWLAMGAVSFVFVIPFLLLFFSNHSTGDFFHVSSGWQNGRENLLLFWLKNSFLVLPLALLGFWKLNSGKKILFSPAFIVFLVANFLMFQPWDWDNIKLLSWSFVFFSILVGFYLAISLKKNFLLRTLAVFIVIVSVLSGLLSVTLQLKDKFVIYDKDDIALSQWAKTNTKRDDVFIVETTPNHPIPGLAGRVVYVGYPGHLWVHGISYNQREVVNNKILAGDFSAVKNAEITISYVVFPKNKVNFPLPPSISEVFENQKYTVLAL